MKFTLDEIIEATGAKILKGEGLQGEFTFSTDTRTLKKGEIYLPLKGENFDGEKFIDNALEAGAVGFFTTREETPLTAHSSQIILKVPDTLIAYLQLARFYRKKINPTTVAITGSSGKTTTKEMAYCVASEKFRTHKSELNFNNEIGLSKTILAMPEDTEVLILEMGMRGLGEIELLSKYSEPDISIIANVGTAHLGRLGSRENISKAKYEIVSHMKQDGLLIAHDDELIKKEKGKRETGKDIESIYFSLSNVQIIKRKEGYSNFIYKDKEYELNIEGDYNIQNALAVIEMGLKLNMRPGEIATGLRKYSPIEKRWEVEEIGGYKIINDSYNANPESMKAAIKTFLDIYKEPLFLVLGDMGELGDEEVKYHREIGEFLAEEIKNKKNVKILTVGQLAFEIAKRLDEKGLSVLSFTGNKEAALYIVEKAQSGTTIMLKASRSMKFEEIVDEVKSKK